jgi:hypothetical protein
MKNHPLVILVVLLLITTIGATAKTTPQSNTQQLIDPTSIPEPSNIDDEILDQSQITYNTDLSFGAVSIDQQINQSIAQSFIPQTQVLTRIQIYLSKELTTTEPCHLILLRNLTDEPLAISTILPENINIYDNYSWIEFDFDDVEITANTTHHLILITNNITDNIYYCGATNTNEYKNGTALIRQGETNSWETLPTTDICFKIFGYYLPDLEIGFVGGFGLTICFTNYGLGDAHNLQYDIIIHGGIYNLIDIEEHGTYGTIPAGGEQNVEIPLFGLGWVNITAKLNDQMLHGQGIVIFVFIF